MSVRVFTSCPRCGEEMQAGFACKASGMSFVAREKFERFAFIDEDVSGAGWSKFVPGKAEYFDSYLCRCCELYIIDYSKTLSRVDTEQLIKSRAE